MPSRRVHSASTVATAAFADGAGSRTRRLEAAGLLEQGRAGRPRRVDLVLSPERPPVIGQVGGGGHARHQQGREEELLVAPGVLGEAVLDGPERVDGRSSQDRRLGGRLQQVGPNVGVDVRGGEAAAAARLSRRLLPLTACGLEHRPGRHEVDPARDVSSRTRGRPGHLVGLVPPPGAMEDVAGARPQAGRVPPLEADAPRRLDPVRRDLQALVEPVGLVEEEREVVLRRRAGCRRPGLARQPDGHAKVVEARVDVAEPDEVHAEDVEQPGLAVVRAGGPERGDRLLAELA